MTTDTAAELDLLDRKVLNVVQTSIPLVETPYAAVAEQVGASEEEVIKRLTDLRSKHVLRQMSAIFDTRRLGYKSSLVAMRFKPERLPEGARVINEHPGVSHNYERTHEYNLWFTLAVPPAETLDKTVEELARRSGAEAYRMLPTIHFFKVGVNFDMMAEETSAFDYSPSAVEGWQTAVPLSDFDIACVRELQGDLPLEHHPFKGMAERLGVTEAQVLAKAQELIDRKLMRRFSAVLHHRRAGFKANVMVVWRVPQEKGEEIGKQMAAFPQVSHCYQRPVYPDWPYSHFTMIHAVTRQRCEEIARQISQKTGVTDYAMLFSVREWKKTRVKYFM